MKIKMIKYCTVIAVSLLMMSCEEEFLQREPLDAISNENFWRTETDIVTYNNGFYHKISNDDDYPILMGLGRGNGLNFYEGLWWQSEMSDDLGATHGRAFEMFVVRTGRHTIPDNPRIMGYKGWDLIWDLNFGLANYDRVNISQDIINRYKAEARLLRGWFYADKVSKFGRVQWIDRPLNIDAPELQGERDSREFIMDKVLEDLNYAVDSLPEDWATGRVDKWVALAVKSRICLFEGTWRKYHGLGGETPWLEESVAAAQQLMDEGGFELYDTDDPVNDYRFTHWQRNQTNNPEVIYARKYEADVNGHFASRLFLNYNGGATKSFVEDFLCEDGLPISLSPLYAGDDSIETVFINRDPRLAQCVLNPADQARLSYPNESNRVYPILVGMAGKNRSNTGYHVIKHWNAIDENSGRNNHTVSPPCLRLGEVYLNFAEAKAELGTITQGDLDISINRLRDRAGIANLTLNPPMDPRYADDGVSSLIVEIRRERRVELFLEGHRYNDLRRWRQGTKLAESDYGILFDAAAQARYPGANVKTTIIDGKPYIDVRKDTDFEPQFDESKHYLWPTPISVISQNPKLGQTPGWE